MGTRSCIGGVTDKPQKVVPQPDDSSLHIASLLEFGEGLRMGGSPAPP